MYFVLIHGFELILNVSPNDVLIRIANRLNKITLGPKLATPKILFPYLWASLEKFSSRNALYHLHHF